VEGTGPGSREIILIESVKGVVLLELEFPDSGGKEISSNLFWLAADTTEYRKLSWTERLS
jgi:hypothetical protein